MMKVFNTEFEVSMRILLLLNESDVSLDADRILYLDYFIIYAKNYGFSEVNINGDGMFMINDLTVQHSLINSSIKSLVLQRLINVNYTQDGYMYIISPEGNSLCERMTSDYSALYKRNINAVLSKIKNLDIKRLKQYAKKKEEEINALRTNK